MNEPVSARRGSQATIDRLVGDLQPVTRLPPFGVRFGVWSLVALAVLAVAAYVPRPDLAVRITETRFLAESTWLMAVTALLAALALRYAEPDRTPARREQRLGLLLAVAALGVATIRPMATDVPLSAVLAAGGRCAWATLKFAAIPTLLLFMAIRRGATVEPSSAGGFAAGAGLVLAYLALRLHCPSDDGFHLFVGHALPVAVGTLAAAALGWRWLRRWRA